jgi:hypothetical protein
MPKENDHMNNMEATIIIKFNEYYSHFNFIYINKVFEHKSDPGGILKNLQLCRTDKGG